MTQYDEALAAKAHSHSGGTQTCKGYKCENCGAEYGEFDAENHNIIIDEAVAPTCTETGLTEGSHCSRCDDMTVAQEEIPAKGHKDTNGADNYKLQQITDYNIINMDIGALNLKESTDSITNTTTYSSDKFTGVAEIYMNNIKGNRFDITINHAQVNSGNFKIVLVHNDEIVPEFKLNELRVTSIIRTEPLLCGLRAKAQTLCLIIIYIKKARDCRSKHRPKHPYRFKGLLQ